MTRGQPDLHSLSLLVGLTTEVKHGKRLLRGLVTGVFMVGDSGCSEDRFVLELTERGRHHYVPYAQFAAG
jgi:hypothetical protein